MTFTFAVPRGGRRRIETRELLFFKKTLLFRRERVKVLAKYIHKIDLEMLQHLYLVKISWNLETKTISFFFPTHFGRGAANSGLGVVGGRPLCRDATDAEIAIFGHQNESPVSRLSNEPKIEP